MKFCKCNFYMDSPEPRRKIYKEGGKANFIDGILICLHCGLPAECQLCEGENPKPVTHIHIDYHVCDEHLAHAVGLIASRE